ncbi:hypothetical protein CFR73_14895 [Novacetimonas maltaceti]|uniref:Uncharacterized protein n=2 Tax=Acetobacteraceae TaxID=433 RepID=A0A2S3VY08_9PROT|nr:hypothetical protein KMAL_28650 [Novacetimonas maltaceti]PYD58372.1 hypothetical protein CFR73_14895 [Novacetimonas maltaceti]GAN96447.1 hypothetical protein Geu3261_0069_024 [Komagataeibacter europaeus NBRC 3261]
MSHSVMLALDVRPGPGLEGLVGALGKGVAYRQDKSREVRHGWGWFCGGFLQIFGALCEVRGTWKPAASTFWRFTAVSRTSQLIP